MVIRVEKNKENPYVILDKDFLNNNNLTWQAKGLLAYLLSLPDNWQINVNDLKNRSKNGREATNSIIKELIKNGYIEREQTKDAKGKFNKYAYKVLEKTKIPLADNPLTENPLTENPLTDYPLTGNSELLYNKQLSNNKLTISKDIDKRSLKTPTKLYLKYLSILEVWNALEQTTIHTPRAIKMLHQLDKYIKALKNGKFASIVDLDKDMLKRNNIPNDITKKQWTEEEIIDIIKKHGLAFKKGYAPDNKKFLPKDICSFFYNPRTSCSFFLKWAANTPTKLTIDVKISDEVIYKMYLTEFKDLINSDRTKNQFIMIVNDLVKEYKVIWDDIGRYLHSQSAFSSYCGSISNSKVFFSNHIKFLKERCRDKLFLSWMGCNGMIWQDYITSIQRKDKTIDLYPTEQKRKQIIKTHLSNKRAKHKGKSEAIEFNPIELLDFLDDGDETEFNKLEIKQKNHMKKQKQAIL